MILLLFFLKSWLKLNTFLLGKGVKQTQLLLKAPKTRDKQAQAKYIILVLLYITHLRILH